MRSKLYIHKNYNEDHSILVIGRVQSGKTSFMIKQAKEDILLTRKSDIVIFISGHTNILKDQTFLRIKNSFKEDPTFNYIQIKDVSSLKNTYIFRKNQILITSKNKTNLNKLKDIIKNSMASNKDLKATIFDDESDFASINISKNKNELSAIYQIILDIKKTIPCLRFFSVTATPFANILSKDSDNFTIKCLTPYNNYFGLKEFNNSRCYFESDQVFKNNPLLLAIFYNHVYRIMTNDITDSQFLINSEIEKKHHKYQEAILKERFEWLLDKRELSFKKESLDEKERKYLLNNFDEFKQIVLELENQVIIMNENLDISNKNIEKGHWIIIGGYKLSRGVTFKTLLTEVIENVPKNTIIADTMLQRARWFGYRGKMFEQIRIYMPKILKQAYLEMEILEELLYDKILTRSHLEEKIKNKQFKYIKSTNKL